MRRLSYFILVLLLIEFLDELIFGLREAAWPLIRADLQLSYFQIGLILSVPGLVGILVESFLGILADTWKRSVIILGGGTALVISSFLVPSSHSFIMLLAASLLAFPASGAYVSLSQAVLMDLEPERREHNMARWTFSGSLAVVSGPLLISAAAWQGWSWRAPFWGVAVFAALVLALSWRAYRGDAATAHFQASEKPLPFLEGLRNAGRALRRGEVWRWMVLLQFGDLMLDILYSYLALYLVDVGKLTPALAGLGVAIWTGVGLLGDFLLIPLLERVRGLAYLRFSALFELVMFPVFLLAPWIPVKLAALGLLGFFNSGWYSILQGKLYAAMPGQSGTVMTLGNIAGFAGKLIPLGIGLLAQTFGLGVAMWALWAGPVALLVGLVGADRGAAEEITV